MSKENIGFVGLGVMGSPMVMNLAKSGFTVTIFDARAEVAQQLAKELAPNVHVAASLKDLAEKSDVVITMLPNGSVVRDVVLGEQGLASGLKQGSLILDTSSCEPWLTRETAAALADKGIAMIDAPVSGAQVGAQAGELVFMVGGADEDLGRIRPLLDAMGKHIFHLGPVSSGHAMKCINNCITATIMTATTEGLLSGQRAGLAPGMMVDVLNVSTGGSWLSETHFHQHVFNRKFDNAFKLELMLKDVRISNELARETKSPVVYAALTEQLWRMADHEQGEHASISTLVQWMENRIGTQLTADGKPVPA